MRTAGAQQSEVLCVTVLCVSHVPYQCVKGVVQLGDSNLQLPYVFDGQV